ncbi:phosphodiesterase [uncultured Agrobacterium sp.]|uniref:phosphodiesterase n=1 Tax=uncultured Agrobacterium sp. TaxID=157277 RepID=UPI00258B5D26|nr:phosphodiesterase [uncultured Agrobacterium sp.]
MMQVLSHRGYWKEPAEKNSVEAFARSFSLGFGTETDLRDSLVDGVPAIVVSHDIPKGGELSFKALLRIAKEHGSPTLALNIKADGLHDLIAETLKEEGYDNYFLFDSSVPDLIQGVKRQLVSYTRLSEYEPVASLYEDPGVSGVWVDIFKPGRWYDAALIEGLLVDGKSVALVAPDLHHRHDEFDTFLEWLVSTGLNERDRLSICTDRPEYAQEKLFNQEKRT